MPMLTTVAMRLPVTPVHSPERTRSAKAYTRSSTSWTSATTSWPSTLSDASAGSRSAVCSTARSSVTLMCSPASMASRRPVTPTSSASASSAASTSPSRRFFDRSTWRSAAARVWRSTHSGVSVARRSGSYDDASSASRAHASVVVGSTAPHARAASRDFASVVWQLVPGDDELVDALLDEHLDHVVVVDAGVLERLHVGGGVVVERPDAVAPHLAVVGDGVEGLLGHRVDGVLDDEVDDVHRVVVVGVLHAGRRPQRPLLARPLASSAAQRSPLKNSSYIWKASRALATPALPRRAGRCPVRPSSPRAACRSRSRPATRRTTPPSGCRRARGRCRRPARGRRRRPPSRCGTARGRRSASR